MRTRRARKKMRTRKTYKTNRKARKKMKARKASKKKKAHEARNLAHSTQYCKLDSISLKVLFSFSN